MAYLRKEKEVVEIDYSLEEVWKGIVNSLKELNWTVDQIDESNHKVKAKTQTGFVSWSSILLIEAIEVDKNTTRVSVVAETPFTTISAIVDFGRARRRIGLLFAVLAKQFEKQKH